MFIPKTVQNDCKDKKKRLRNNLLLRYFLKHIYFTTISLSQTKRANERSKIRTRSWREIALFIRTISLSQTKRANERSKIRTRSWREIALFIKNKKMRKHS